ncbi:hypothetical protein EV178_002733 [Coemansia sp. RSA 1646]|nr:hypothetical protein EV178_002733 [Coemansia sp. RSA 1646]
MLIQLPPGFGRTFSKLQLLDISGNQIAALPEDISHLRCLRELNASRNALIGLPITIGSLRSLEVLNIAENYIVSLDASVSRLENLRMLNISDNRITHLPTCLGLLAQNIRILLVDGNPFDKGQRDMVEPILTISSRDAKRITKTREKEGKARERAIRRGEISSNATEADSPLHSKEYVAAIRKLMTPRQSSAMDGPAAFTERSSLSSTSQESHGSSMDDAFGLIQDAAKVSRVLWQLRDAWDLDPHHSESDSVENMLAQLQSGNVRIDGASGIDRVYRGKSPNAGSSQRMKILSELLVTEVTYVDTLKNVVGVYLNPMREAKVLSESELREIFSNIEVILAFHNDHFLPAITYGISNPDMAIGNVFLHHGAHLKLYSTYTNNHEISVKTLGSVSSRRSVSAFIQNARHDVTQIGQVGLDGHLLTPIQRLPRYRMLLTDLLSNTPVDHPDHETLYTALKELNSTIYEVNEKKRTFENQSRLQKIQEKVAGSSGVPIVTPHRVFKLTANFRLQVFSEPTRSKKGDFVVRRIGLGTVYRFFLFNDMIMQCTIIMNKDLRLNRIYRLGTRVAPAEVTCDNELRIVDAEGILYLKGDIAEIQKWTREINSRLE